MSTLPSVLVIIVTWNKKSYVVDLLNSLQKLSYPVEQFDVLVVDNASNDGTAEVLKRDFPDVHVIENSENLGGTGGFNTGLQYAFEQPEGKYDYLWLLDNDVQVHYNALSELIDLLESEQDVAIAGSTMMQLTTPWRINEMGAYVDLGRGRLELNRHQEDVSGLEGKTLEQLHESDIDLSEHLKHCRPSMDVEYIAAASLVIRAQVAKKAGLWDDYFIHYDDVEWCLRIARMGYRIMVSARSLIWHLPADYKVPTWVLYYDNRNVLYMLEKHAGPGSVKGTRSWIKKKSLYYTLLGKRDLARLHLEAIQDYEQKKTGKKDIVLDDCYYSLLEVEKLLQEEGIKRILIPWTVNLQASNLQSTLVKTMKIRSDLHVDYLVPPPFLKDALLCQLPGAGSLHVPAGRIRRMLAYLRMRNKYDLIFQSDYQPILPLNLVAKKILFVNYEGASLRLRPSLKMIVKFIRSFLKQRGGLDS
ncbi:MAG: glycosyltransferase family 2 protein [Desulfobulbaceae bacterium]|nr:glycosyltransferase family 2 protein [Desulfobulbaceae bacterium]